MDRGIENAIDEEIILKCDEYYLLSISYYDSFMEYLQSKNNI